MILVNYLIFTLNYPKITQNSFFLLKLWPICDREANMRNMKKYAWPDTHFRFYLTHILDFVSPERLWTNAKYIYIFQNSKKNVGWPIKNQLCQNKCQNISIYSFFDHSRRSFVIFGLRKLNLVQENFLLNLMFLL